MVDLDAVRRAKALDSKRSKDRIAAAFIADHEIGDAGELELAEEAGFILLIAANVRGPVDEADERPVPQLHHLLRNVLDVNLRPAGGRSGDQVQDSHSYRIVGSGPTEAKLASGRLFARRDGASLAA